MKINLKLFLLLSVIISCKKNTFQSDIKTLNLTSSFNKEGERISLSSIAEKIDYIQLETNSECLIGKIFEPNREIQFYNDNIYINSGKILRFNNSGDFLNKIGVNGRGPREFIEASSFTSVKSKMNNQIVVYSAKQQKVIYYHDNGNYIKEFPLEFWPSEMTYINEKLLFINAIGGRSNTNYNTITIISNEGEIKKQLLPKKSEANKNLIMTKMNNYYYLKDTLNYWENNYDTIWQITSDFKTIPKYHINIGKDIMPLKMRTKENMLNFKIFIKYDMIERLYETNRFLFLRVIYNKKYYNFYYDKISKQINSTKFKRPFGKGSHFSFYNDIDGGTPFWPMGRVSDNKMFMLVYGYEMKDYIAKKGKAFDAIDMSNREKLLKLVENSKISDNPILMVVTLKE